MLSFGHRPALKRTSGWSKRQPAATETDLAPPDEGRWICGQSLSVQVEPEANGRRVPGHDLDRHVNVVVVDGLDIFGPQTRPGGHFVRREAEALTLLPGSAGGCLHSSVFSSAPGGLLVMLRPLRPVLVGIELSDEALLDESSMHDQSTE